MQERCDWCKNTFKQYQKYHDKEWGVPVYDDKGHFEFLILEGAQAGLSWSTILKRREGYRKAFANFNVKQVANFDEQKIQSLCTNSAIIRNKLKIRSAVTNAQHFIDIQNEIGSFTEYIWSFTGGKPIQNHWKTQDEVPAVTEESTKLSEDLQKRGFKFTGPTIMYAHLQATGLVNDHLVKCFRHEEVKG